MHHEPFVLLHRSQFASPVLIVNMMAPPRGLDRSLIGRTHWIGRIDHAASTLWPSPLAVGSICALVPDPSWLLRARMPEWTIPASETAELLASLPPHRAIRSGQGRILGGALQRVRWALHRDRQSGHRLFVQYAGANVTLETTYPAARAVRPGHALDVCIALETALGGPRHFHLLESVGGVRHLHLEDTTRPRRRRRSGRWRWKRPSFQRKGTTGGDSLPGHDTI